MKEVLTVDASPGARLVLPFPQFLPSRRSALASADHILGESRLRPESLFRDPAGFAVAASRCLESLCALPEPSWPDPDLGAVEDYVEHDAFFNVIRVRDNAGVAFLAGAALSHARVVLDLRTMGTTMSVAEVASLLDGYALLRRFAARMSTVAPELPAAGVPLTEGDAYRPAGRWHLGHQHFFVQIQALVVALNVLGTAVTDGDDPTVREGLLLAARLALSAAAGLRYAGDFRSGDYRSVRDTMLPPRLNEGFSGMQTRDHHALVRSFHALPLAELRDRTAEYETFLRAVRAMYIAHVRVCDHFGGRMGPSMRMEARSHEHPHGRASVLVEALAHRRLRSLERSS